MTNLPLSLRAIPRETRFYDPLALRLRTRCHREAAWGGPHNKKEDVMATIGRFKKKGAGYTGSIETLTLRAKITFEPADKNSDRAPDFRVFHIGDDFTSEIGAAWKKTS